MPQLNYYSDDSPDGTGYWDLIEKWCPCDVDFNDYLRRENIEGNSIFHFGTGAHHSVGLAQLKYSKPNYVTAVTASPGEYQVYVDLILDDTNLANIYKVTFADIYTFNESQLPRFDIVTLFHLCEYWDPIKSGYASLDDAALLDLMIRRLKPGGLLLVYPRSRGWKKAEPILDQAVRARKLRFETRFKSLKIYRARAPFDRLVPGIKRGAALVKAPLRAARNYLHRSVRIDRNHELSGPVRRR